MHDYREDRDQYSDSDLNNLNIHDNIIIPPPLEPGWKMKLWKKSNVIFSGLILFYLTGAALWWTAGLAVRNIPGIALLLSGAPPFILEGFSLLAAVAALLIPCLFILKLEKLPRAAIIPFAGKINPHIILTAVGCCLGASVIGVFLSHYVSYIFEGIGGVTPDMPELLPEMTNTGAMVVRVINITLVPAIFEELLFRGAVMQPLRRYGDRFALIVSSFLFAVAHGNMIQAPNAFVAGLVFGYFAMRTNSLLVPIIMHLINNSFAAFIGLYMLSNQAEEIWVLGAGYLFFCLIAGVVGLIAAMKLYPEPLHDYRQARTPVIKYVIFAFSPAAAAFIYLTVRSMRYFLIPL